MSMGGDFEPQRPELMSGHFLELMKDSHGWVLPRPDGTKATCGGPTMCRICNMEKLLFSTHDRVTVMEGFNIRPGDKILLIAPPNANSTRIRDVMDRLGKDFPEVHFTAVAGFTGVQVAKKEPTE